MVKVPLIGLSLHFNIDESLWHNRYGHLNSLYLERLIHHLVEPTFSNLAKINVFFRFYSFFGFIHKKDMCFQHKLGIRQIKLKKIHHFYRKSSGKLKIQIKNDYYINWKNTKIQKIYDNLR